MAWLRKKTALLGLGWMLLAAATAGLVTRWMLNQSHHHRHEARHGPLEDSEKAFHDWMHQHLRLTTEQARLLKPFEQKFEEERQRLRREIQAVGRELARTVSAVSAMTPESEDLLRRLNTAQGELQRATLQHFFDMKVHLDDAQQAKLSRWTQDSLLHQEAAHE